MEIDDTQIIIDYIDSKLSQGLKREDLAKRISSPSQRTFIIRSARNNKKQQARKTIGEDFLQGQVNFTTGADSAINRTGAVLIMD